MKTSGRNRSVTTDLPIPLGVFVRSWCVRAFSGHFDAGPGRTSSPYTWQSVARTVAVVELSFCPTCWSNANFVMKSDWDFICRLRCKTSQLMIPVAYPLFWHFGTSIGLGTVNSIFLGPFAKLRKSTIGFMSFRLSVRLSIRPHGTARLPLDGLWWNVILEFFLFENLSRNFKFH